MTDKFEAAVLDIFRSIRANSPVVDQQIALSDALHADLSELALDSLERMDLIMQIEDVFHIALDERDVIRCTTLAELAQLVAKTQ